MSRPPLCPMCGAASVRVCELREETGGECPWELSEDEDDDPQDEPHPEDDERFGP